MAPVNVGGGGQKFADVDPARLGTPESAFRPSLADVVANLAERLGEIIQRPAKPFGLNVISVQAKNKVTLMKFRNVRQPDKKRTRY